MIMTGFPNIVNQDSKSLKTVLVQPDGVNYDVQHPLPTNGDSAYFKDIDVARSDVTGWSIDGNFDKATVLESFVSDLKTVKTNTAVDNPKTIFIQFLRPLKTRFYGMSTINNGIKNSKIELIQAGEVVATYDNSADNTPRDIELALTPLVLFDALKVTFHTTDEINLAFIGAFKSMDVASEIQGLDPDGIPRTLGLSSEGYAFIEDRSNGLSIAEGNVTGKTFIHKFGNAPSFDVADLFVNIWDGADNNGIDEPHYNYSTSAIIDTVSTSDIGNTQNINVQGLDANRLLVTQDIVLDGQNKVTLDTPLLRVFRMKNNGSTDITGKVYCYEDTAIVLGIPTDTTKIRAMINGAENQTLMAVYTVPAGKTAYLRQMYCTTAGARKTSAHNWKMRVRPLGGVFQTKYTSTILAGATGKESHTYIEPEVIQEQSDIEIIANTDEDAAAMSAGFDIVLVDL